MKVKYLTICVQDGGDVQSVTPFDSYKEANDFIGKDAARMYSDIEDHLNSAIEVYAGGAEVVDGEDVYSWSVYPLILEK